ncbi:MAG TPA: nucleotidyltransferase family protein [Candidatus Binatia bacterium]|nr:nucleotidyltransferase family protein [Candidatus Binatia bacterium]
MKAMILAAGLGTRLRPLTNDRPKALVEIGGRTLLELTLARLGKFGVTEVIVNAHHHADMMIEFLKSKERCGIQIKISCEDLLLDTGGGLKKAAWFFQSGAVDDAFIVHNVDVLSGIDLHRMLQYHRENNALATLAVQSRKTSRYLLFDEALKLCGRLKEGKLEELNSEPQKPEALAFCGIHIISPRIFPLLTEDGAFSIVDSYLRLASRGEKILAFRTDDSYWVDVGKPENLKQAEQYLKTRSQS